MKKGFTLVEVLVSITLFMLMFGVILSTYSLAVRGQQKQKEYLYFENICMDIDHYYDTYNTTWEEEYFSKDVSTVYYNEKFEVVSSPSRYAMTIWYENEELYISVYNVEKNYYVIKDLYYGGSKNAQP